MTDELDGDAIIISLQEEFDVDITSHQEEQLLQARVGQMISWIEDAVTEWEETSWDHGPHREPPQGGGWNYTVVCGFSVQFQI